MNRLFFLFFCFVSCAFAEKTDLLFHLHDAGETYALLPVIPDGQHFNSIPLQKGLAKKVSCVEGFAQAVKEAMETDVSGFFEVMGIPQNSTANCKAAILENLR